MAGISAKTTTASILHLCQFAMTSTPLASDGANPMQRPMRDPGEHSWLKQWLGSGLADTGFYKTNINNDKSANYFSCTSINC